MSKNDFKITRKPSINIEEYRKLHPNWNLVIEKDTTRDGYGWIIHRSPKPIKSFDLENGAPKEMIDKKVADKNNVEIIPAKLQLFPRKQEGY